MKSHRTAVVSRRFEKHGDNVVELKALPLGEQSSITFGAFIKGDHTEWEDCKCAQRMR